MRTVTAPSCAFVGLALLATLGCPGPGAGPAAVLDKGQLLDAYREGPDTIRRSFECLQKDSEGDCVANKCTASPAGSEYNCASFAGSCIDAGLHWNGTSQEGVCAVPL